VAGTLCAATALAVLPAAASATPGHFRGVITRPTEAGRAYKAKAHPSSRLRRGGANMTYHGGPVMHSDANYTIFWAPTGAAAFPPNYATIINGFFTNVAGADGLNTNDYSIAKQYTDTTNTGFTYGASYGNGNTFYDTDAYPANGCNAGGGKCITDAQLQSEISKFVTAKSLPRGPNTMYFVYTPSGVASCFDSSGSQCSTNVYCAYHSNIGSGNSGILYANMPYAAVSGCESGEYPNNSVPADSVLNVTSHENIEGITDPLGTAWFDSSGNEIGDKCAWNFGSPLGGGSGTEFNESINGGHYWLQQEWSNAASGCRQHA
jgi:hypothetical protein